MSEPTTDVTDLLTLLDDMDRMRTIAPEVFDDPIVTSAVVVQHNGHIVMRAADGDRAWTFISMGDVLQMHAHGWHGQIITPTHARALALALVAWADRIEPPR